MPVCLAHPQLSPIPFVYPVRKRSAGEILTKTIALALKILLWPVHWIAKTLVTRCLRPLLFHRASTAPRPYADPLFAEGTKICWNEGKLSLEMTHFHHAAPHHATAIFCCGNDAPFAAYAHVVRLYRSLGLNLLLFNYCGVGGSKGAPSEASIYAATEAAHRYVSATGVPNHKIVMHGYSFGGPSAAYVAAKKAGVHLFLDRTFARASLIVGDRMHKAGFRGALAPLRWLARGLMEYAWPHATERHIRDVRGHWAILSSPHDTTMAESSQKHTKRIVTAFAKAHRLKHLQHQALQAKTLKPVKIGHFCPLFENLQATEHLREFLKPILTNS